MSLDRASRVRDVYAHPVGRDAIDRILLQLNRSRSWITNPLIANLRLGVLEALTARFTGPGFLDALLALLNAHPERTIAASGEAVEAWWKEAVFYQIYPRSFADSDGDGNGDLRGILSHLDYLQDLGVDCLWLGPVYDSPNEDNGYDVRDYRAVMAEMGTLQDLDDLIAACHERGMKLIMDLVVNHTSAEHEWFQQAQHDPDGPFGDYYFLRPGKPDTPPNNWTSFFSGPAWRWLPANNRWVLRLFAPGQPDLNWDNPAVRDEVTEIVSWWLDRGVDGFRLDVINYISKMPGLPNGHRFIGDLMGFHGIEHYYYGPHLHEYLRELRGRSFDPHRAFLVGETPGIGIEMGRLLAASDRGELDLVFLFDHLENPGKIRWDDYRYDLNHLKAHYVDYQSRLTANDWMSIFWENHDNPRMISKINPDPQHRTMIGKLLATMALTMRGTPFLYQGQEIAAVNQNFTGLDDLSDIESITRYRETLDRPGEVDGWPEILAGSRDHARTPMRWAPTEGLGFTTGTPWLEPREDSAGFTVAEQHDDPHSVLNHYRELIVLRRAHRALTRGRIDVVEPDAKDWFGYYRVDGADRFFIELNLSDRRLVSRHNSGGRLALGSASDGDSDSKEPGPTLAPYEARVFHVRY